MSSNPNLEDETPDVSKGRYGSVKIMSSGEHRDRIYTDVKDLSGDMAGQNVWIRARLHSSKSEDKRCYLILRQTFNTVRLLISADEHQVSHQLVKYTSSITKESVVDVSATVSKTSQPVEACSVHDVELVGIEVWTVSAAKADLPFQVEDVVRIDTDDLNLITADLNKRLDNRVLDLRTPLSQAVFRIEAGVCRLYRESLTRQGFFEIHVPKLVTGNVYDLLPVVHFNKTAFLVSTLQFHKQCVIAADFDKVFTIGSMYRPEEFTSHRHLVEFVGLDMEMTIKNHYHEALDVIGKTFIDMFNGLREQYASEIAIVASQYKVEPFKFLDPALRLEFPVAVQMLRDAGVTIDEKEVLSIPQEKILGRLIREKYDTDFFILDKYPITPIHFWVMPDRDNPNLTNAYDMFMRGEEVLSGCERVADPELLLEKAKLSNIDIKSMSFYFDSFKYGCPPHAGGGIGLERFVMLYLGLDNIRRASMFPRDHLRLTP